MTIQLPPPLSPEEEIEIRAEILRCLDKLGSTLDEIVQSLQDLKIQGSCRQPELCVLAEYLTLMMPGYKFLVASSQVVVANTSIKHIRLPARFKALVYNFDQDKYPQLVKTL